MLGWALTFLILSLVAYYAGFFALAGTSWGLVFHHSTRHTKHSKTSAYTPPE